MMKEKDRLNALEVALNNEMREREFYLKNAKRTKNVLGKSMFQQIGDEELEHYERLKQLSQKWGKQERWPKTVPLKVKDTVVKDILLDFVKKVDQTPEGDADDLKAVKIAVDFEAKGAKYYAEMRDMVSDPGRRSSSISSQKSRMSIIYLSKIRRNTSPTLNRGTERQNIILWMEDKSSVSSGDEARGNDQAGSPCWIVHRSERVPSQREEGSRRLLINCKWIQTRKGLSFRRFIKII